MGELRFARKWVFAFATLLFVGFAYSAPKAATVVTFGGGEITGVTGLEIGGTTYNVQLFDGSCVVGYFGCNEALDLPFTTEILAKQALGAFLDVVRPAFNSAPISNDPTKIFGCTGPIAQCVFNLPFELVPGNAVVGPSVNVALGVAANNGFVGLFPVPPGTGNWERTVDLSTQNPNVYVQFSEATVSPVPIPSVFPIFAAIMGLLGFLNWRRRRATAAA